MIHVACFVFFLILACIGWMFRGIIKQLWVGTSKDISKVENKLTKENQNNE